VARLRRWLPAILLASALGPAADEEIAQPPPLSIALLDFEDRAGFQGRWKLARDVPEFLGRYLDGEDAFDVVSAERVVEAQADPGLSGLQGRDLAVAAGRLLEADIVIQGVVETFGMRRVTAGDPNLAGYKSYHSRVRIGEVDVIRVATEQLLGTVEVSRDSTETPLGLDLFGRPRRQDREFRELFHLEFGSERFYELPLGIVADAAFEELRRQIGALLTERPPIDLTSDNAVVLAVDGTEVFLGIGLEDNVEYGDLLPLYQDSLRVALARVSEVIGPHLSKAVIVDGAARVEAGSRIGQRLSRTGVVE
jgi:hypothetical protein